MNTCLPACPPLPTRYACSGVYYLHRRCNIVQRDLKARNILVDESLNAKVADFGLSRVLDEKGASLPPSSSSSS